MKKISSLFSALILSAAVGCTPASPAKIGFMGPMSGDAASYGELMSQAVRLAADEKNAAGGIGGKKVVVIIADDEAKVDKGADAAEKLTGKAKVWGFVGSVFSSVSLSVAPKAESSKTIMISPSSTHKDLPGKGGYIFRTIMNDSVQAKIFAKYAVKKAKIKTAAILYLRTDYSQGLAEEFKTQFEKEGGRVLAMESGVPGSRDFTAQLTKIKSVKAHALYIPDDTAEIAAILAQAAQLGITTKILSSGRYSDSKIFESAGKNAEGAVYSRIESDNGGVTKKFKDDYRAKWGADADEFSMNAYDAANILIAAIEKTYNESSDEDKKAWNLDRAKIRNYVAQTKNFPGVSGRISFTPQGDESKAICIYKNAHGSPALLGKYLLDDKENLAEEK
ncbi:MAG: ABC transporter substrate-binding protein [Spirochaetota bacterium]